MEVEMGMNEGTMGLITGFYIIYYSLLAAFWAAMLMIFFTTLKDNEPK